MEQWRLEKKNHDMAPKPMTYALTCSFSHTNHHCRHDSLSPIVVYTIKGGPQYCDHLGPAPEGSVQWYAQQAASMCMYISPRGRNE